MSADGTEAAHGHSPNAEMNGNGEYHEIGDPDFPTDATSKVEELDHVKNPHADANNTDVIPTSDELSTDTVEKANAVSDSSPQAKEYPVDNEYHKPNVHKPDKSHETTKRERGHDSHRGNGNPRGGGTKGERSTGRRSKKTTADVSGNAIKRPPHASSHPTVEEKQQSSSSAQAAKLEPIKHPSMGKNRGGVGEGASTKQSESRTPRSGTVLPAVKKQPYGHRNDQNNSRQAETPDKTSSSSSPAAAAAAAPHDDHDEGDNGNDPAAVDTETAGKPQQHRHNDGKHSQKVKHRSRSHSRRQRQQQQQQQRLSPCEYPVEGGTQDGDGKHEDREGNAHRCESGEYLALLDYYEELYKDDRSLARVRQLLSLDDMTRTREVKPPRSSKRGNPNPSQQPQQHRQRPHRPPRQEEENNRKEEHRQSNENANDDDTMGKDGEKKKKWVPVSRGANHLLLMTSVSLHSGKHDTQAVDGGGDYPQEPFGHPENHKSMTHLPTPSGHRPKQQQGVYQRCLQQLIERSNNGGDGAPHLSYSYSCILSGRHRSSSSRFRVTKEATLHSPSPSPPLKRETGEETCAGDATPERICDKPSNAESGTASPPTTSAEESKGHDEQDQHEKNEEQQKEEEETERRSNEQRKKEEQRENDLDAFHELEYEPLVHGNKNEKSANSVHSMGAEEEHGHSEGESPQELIV